ncbi:hypothetical protein PHJA_000031800 [Phtheirospermum japonicum]|uniref:Uncharacterized protein n=1 Tax=Phtheirospermum japonicum TaxID=374723 RepID=A0A830B2J9_9LAMI|nr:hypothetical protein PHJA_000031800 [Phtheirospermum japonicum]
MSTKSATARKEGKFVRYMKAPVRILARARDFYVHSLNDCAGQVAYYGSAVGCPTPYNPATLPRSFSTNSSCYTNHSSRDEDLRELVRIASTRGLVGKTEADLLRSGKSPASAVSRSRTVVIGRIDEDKACDQFEENDVGEIRPLIYHRSKSYGASGRSRMV